MNELILIIVSITLTAILIHLYFSNVVELRNESEFKDIVEYQVRLAVQLLSENPQIISSLSKVRFFPDRSGSLIVLDYNGKLLTDGSDLGLTDHETVKKIVQVAKHGGGYVRYFHGGGIFNAFILPVPNQNQIVMSGLFIDKDHILNRKQWRRCDQPMIKKHVTVTNSNS